MADLRVQQHSGALLQNLTLSMLSTAPAAEAQVRKALGSTSVWESLDNVMAIETSAAPAFRLTSASRRHSASRFVRA